MNRYILTIALIVLFLEGSGQWSTNPDVNTVIASASGEEAIPKIATNDQGTTYIAWFSNESGNYNVRVQKFDLFGNALWEEGGLLVSDNPSMSWLTDWAITVDLEGAVVLTFQDVRNGDNDVFVYKISSDGAFVWGDNGIELSSGPAFDAAPKVCVTASNNIIVAWQADDVTILQKLSPAGDKLWGDNGIILSGSNTYSWPQLMPVGNDDVILKYFEDSGPVWAPTRHVFTQRYDPDGNAVWDAPAIVSNAGGISAWTQVFSMIPDGNEGFYIAWHDDRDEDNHSSVFVQHIASDGQVLLGDDGAEASTQPGRQNFYPYLALPENSNEIFVFWNEMDSDQNNRGLYGQKINEFGERLWTDHGKPLIEISTTNVYPFSASQSGDNMIIFYESHWSVIEAGIRAMMVDPEGMFVWSEQSVELCSVQSEKVHSVAGHFAMGQWISAWEDDRNGGKDIYAQNIQLDGSLGALSPIPELSIHPDTLFIDENGITYFIHLFNPSISPYTLYTIFENSTYWDVDEYPEFPFTLEPTDTLTLQIPVYYTGYGGSGSGYVYDTLFALGEEDTTTSIVAFNIDVIPGIHEDPSNSIRVFPNPAGSYAIFEWNKTMLYAQDLFIHSTDGKLIQHWTIKEENKIIWDGKDRKDVSVPPGIYLYTLKTSDAFLGGKVILTR